MAWQRHDRVLVLEARSLLWALDPLAETPEGGVVITVAQGPDLERLRAQLQVLDALRQPQLLVVPPHSPETLGAQLAAEAGGRFDRVVARQPWQHLNAGQVGAWIGAVGAQLSPNGEWRLLFSTPQLGPCAGLQSVLNGAEPPLQALVEELTGLEQQRLLGQPGPGQIARSGLIAQGWSVQEQHWQEALQLELSPALIERWLGPDSTYLQELASLRGTPLGADAVRTLREAFSSHLGQAVPQALEHTLLLATKKPRQRRGP